MRVAAALSVAAAIVAGVTMGSSAREGTGWGQSPDVHPALVIHAGGEYRGGYIDQVSGSFRLDRDEFSGLMLTPDRTRAGGGICANSGTFGVGDAFNPDAPAEWRIDARLVDVADDTATIDVRWSRRLNLPGIAADDMGPIEKRLVLKEGDRGVLDFVKTPPGSAEGCDSFVVSLELLFQGPRALDSAAIGYDLWLVQQDADGRLVTDRFQTATKQSGRAEYFFRTLRYGLDGTPAPAEEGTNETLNVNVRGAVRGRVRSDGLIDLSIEETRSAGTSSSVRSNFGRKYLTVQSGETVEIEVPQVEADLPSVGNLADILRGQRTAIRVTARQLR